MKISKQKYMEKSGITLIALVITIIVLLILAGVSLSLVSGGDGILSKAGKAVNATNEAKVEEEIELALAELKTQYYQERYVDKTTEVAYVDWVKTELSENEYTTGSGATIKYDSNLIVYTDSNGNVTNSSMDSDGNVTVDVVELKDASDEVKIANNFGEATASCSSGIYTISSIKMIDGTEYGSTEMLGNGSTPTMPVGVIIFIERKLL